MKEWSNYMKFGAVEYISRAEAERLLHQGTEALPMQWVETFKNAGKSTPDNPIPMEFKARLVARGALQWNFTRTDSPTVDNEGVSLILSWVASNKLVLKCGELDHGYFQGEKLDRPLLLVVPKTGIPGSGLSPGD